MRRKHDQEHFLATLLAPQSARASMFAVRAFNVEIATIKDAVKRSSQSKTHAQNAGAMRMQW